jgi:outer membrane protein assembly factor BamA
MSQGEAPVILDSSLTRASLEQIKTFLFNKGYFNATVKDSVHISGKKADVSYIIRPGKPYKIYQINYLFEDPGLAPDVYSDTNNCKVRRNDVYDKDILDAESDRITAQLNNTGYYYFAKQYVSYTLDTNGRTHLIKVTINIKKFLRRDPNNKDSTIEIPHSSYRIRHVNVQMYYDPTSVIYHADDTIRYNGLTIVYPKEQVCLKPNVLGPKIVISPGDVYRVKNKNDTYTGLSQLNEFSYVSIKYVLVKDSNYLDCYIQLMPVVKHAIGAEFEATNTGGDAGIQGDVSYENYNQFNGAEKLIFKLNGGLIAQQDFTSSTGDFLFNTADLGPELDLSIPRPLFLYNTLLHLFPFNQIHFTNPQTTLKLSFNYEERYEYYIRHVLSFSYALDVTGRKKKSHLTFALFEWNLVNATVFPIFAQELVQYNPYFQNSFQKQVITDGRVSWILNTQDQAKRQKHFNYYKIDLEWSGLVFDALEHWHLLNLPVESGSYYIQQVGAPYSQYVKLDGEWRHYFILDKKQKIAIRFLAGVGLPYDNSSELPFIKSFWAGGSNDIRAWQMQTLGPGGSPASNVAGQVGATKLEGNWEYRVNLVKYIDLALFIDAGNIWLIKSPTNEGTPALADAYMQLEGPNSVLNEIAIGAGPGLRLDFNYFVFRIDFGFPLKDPSLPDGQRWINLDESARRMVLNIGVGYPF